MRIDHKLSQVQVDRFEISDDLVFQYSDSLPEFEREPALFRAIQVFWQSRRISSLLSYLRQQMNQEYNRKN